MKGKSVRLALVTMGSLGDIHPLLGLGRAMAHRGHHVTLLSNPVFEALATGQGLAFVPVGSTEEQHQTLNHPKLWHPVDGLGVMWRYMLRPALWPTVQALDAWRQQMGEGERLLVLANPVAMGARLASEAWGLPLVSTYTAATMLRTSIPPMTLAQWQLPGWTPQWLPRLAWGVLDRFKLQPLVLPTLNDMRHRLGLPPLAESVFGQWMHSPSAGLTLFPQWFAPLARDWPSQVVAGEFPLFDDGAELHPGLREFLDQGTPPVVVMPGTGQLHGAALFRAAAQALSALGLRGVMLGAVPGDVAALGPREGVWCGEHQPFAQLLPRSRVLVHHGGVGSSAQALRAGIPQLLWPQAYDQFDNAMRLQQLGVAARLPGSEPTAAGVRQGLAGLLSSEAVACAAAEGARRLKETQKGLVRMCEQLEDWA